MDEYKVLQITPVAGTIYAIFKKDQPKQTRKFKVRAWALTEVQTEDPDPESQSPFTFTKVMGMIDCPDYSTGLMTIDEVCDEYGESYGNFIEYRDEE